MSGRELLTPDEVRGLDNRYAILFIRGAKPVMDLKYELTDHPAIRHTVDGGGPPYIHKGRHKPAFVQVGLSFQSHDPSQRSNGFLTLAGGIVITFTKEILTLITG